MGAGAAGRHRHDSRPAGHSRCAATALKHNRPRNEKAPRVRASLCRGEPRRCGTTRGSCAFASSPTAWVALTGWTRRDRNSDHQAAICFGDGGRGRGSVVCELASQRALGPRRARSGLRTSNYHSVGGNVTEQDGTELARLSAYVQRNALLPADCRGAASLAPASVQFNSGENAQ
jgi:hypothetical protein